MNAIKASIRSLAPVPGYHEDKDQHAQHYESLDSRQKGIAFPEAILQ